MSGNTPVILSRLAGSKELSVVGNDITNNASKKKELILMLEERVVVFTLKGKVYKL